VAQGSFADAVAAGASVHELGRYVVDRVDAFTHGEDVVLDFLTKAAVGDFCKALGFAADRNWAELPLDEIAPLSEVNHVNVVPEDEGMKILDVIKSLLSKKVLTPTNEGRPQPHIINDLLPQGRFRDAKCYGHTWEWSYALAVELEHGRDRGMNVTMNHPLLTGLVVLAHLSEDTLYYARLYVMEAEGELFNLQLEKKPWSDVHEALETLALARQNLNERIQEKLADA